MCGYMTVPKTDVVVLYIMLLIFMKFRQCGLSYSLFLVTVIVINVVELPLQLKLIFQLILVISVSKCIKREAQTTPKTLPSSVYEMLIIKRQHIRCH